MANIPMDGPYFQLKTGTGTNTYVISNGSDQTVSTIAVHIVNKTSLVASITVKARSAVKEASDNAVPFVGTEYRKMFLNALAGDGSLVATAITDTSLILIPSTGMQIALDVTFTSGVGDIYVQRLSGPSVI